jgi:ABC-type dipeptide/oligopeptide/nickel transport system ATPase subunit
MMPTSMFEVIWKIVREGNLQKWIYSIGITTALCFICVYYETQSFTKLIRTSEEPKTHILYMLLWQTAGNIVSYIDSYVRMKYFNPTLDEKSSKYLWTLIQNSDPKWAVDQGDLDTPIKDAKNAIKGIIQQSVQIVNPMFLVIVEITTVINLIGIVAGLSIMFSIFVVAIVGFNILKYNFTESTKIEEEKTLKRPFLRSLTKNYTKHILNGKGETAKDMIIDKENDITTLSKSLNITIMGKFRRLRSVHSVLIALALFQLSNYVEGKDYIAVLIAVRSAYQNISWLFHSANHLFETASTWGAIEKILQTYKPMTHVPSKELDLYDIIPNLKPGETVHIKGESGCGKTTWMIRKLIYLYHTYKVQWLYLDQGMSLDLTDQKIYDIMSDLVDGHLNVVILYQYAEKLGIDHLINNDVINKKFQKPSGGEQKRIMFLTNILPTLHNIGNVKVMFLDEVTAGLDPNSWNKVMGVIDDLKINYNIAMVIIDHHDIVKVDYTYKVKKKYIAITKKDLNSCDISFPKKDGFMIRDWLKCKFQDWMKSQLEAYKSIKKDDDTEDVLVWLEDIEEEPNSP